MHERVVCYSFLPQQNMFFARSIHCACCWNIYVSLSHKQKTSSIEKIEKISIESQTH